MIGSAFAFETHASSEHFDGRSSGKATASRGHFWPKGDSLRFPRCSDADPSVSKDPVAASHFDVADYLHYHGFWPVK